MGGKTQTTTQNQTQQYSPYALGQLQDIYNRASQVASTPYQPYTGQLVADMNPITQSGVNNINASYGTAQPYINQASQYATTGAGTISPGQIQNYLNPYQNSVINATQANMNENNAQQQSSLVGNAAMKGALGGDRVGVAQAELARQQKLADNQTLAGLNSQNYSQALAAAQGDRAAAAQGAYTFGNLGTTAQGAALQGGQAQIGAGNVAQQQNQNQLSAQYQQYLQARAFPYQQAQFLAQIGLPAAGAMGGTSVGQRTTTSPGPNLFGQLGGLALAGASLFKDGGRVYEYASGGGIPGITDGTGIIPLSGGAIAMPQQHQFTPLSMPTIKPQDDIAPISKGLMALGKSGNVKDWLGGGNVADNSAAGANATGSGLGGSSGMFASSDMANNPFKDIGATGVIGMGGELYPMFARGGAVDDHADFMNTVRSIHRGLKESRGGSVMDMTRGADGVFVPQGYAEGGATYAIDQVGNNPFRDIGASGVVSWGGNQFPMFGKSDIDLSGIKPVVDALNDSVSFHRSRGEDDRASQLEKQRDDYIQKIKQGIKSDRGYASGGDVSNAFRLDDAFNTIAAQPDAFDPDFSKAALLHYGENAIKGDPRAYAGTTWADLGLSDKPNAPADSSVPFPMARPNAIAQNDDPDMATPEQISAMVHGTQGPTGAAPSAVPAMPSGDDDGAMPPSALGYSSDTTSGASPFAFKMPQFGVGSAAEKAQAGADNRGIFGLPISDKARMAILTAGLGMMASKSPFALSALGEGGLKGVATYADQQKQEQGLTLEGQKLAQQAEQFAKTYGLNKDKFDWQKDQQNQPSIPDGYRQTDKGLEAIPGGPADPTVARSLSEARRTASSMTPETADFLAERVLSGDTRALIGLGRGAQGAENLQLIQGLVAQKAKERGLDPTDILAKAAEQSGQLASQRTFGTQTARMAINATEASSAIDLGRQASDNVPRGNWVPVTKAIQAYQRGTSDPSLAKFGAANLAIINTYARAISPTGVPTVHDKEHAEQLLSTAMGPDAYRAVLDQMQAEIKIAHEAAPKAKKELEDIRKGRTSEPSAPTSSAVPASDKREVNKVYDTPKGKARWMGNGWQLVQ